MSDVNWADFSEEDIVKKLKGYRTAANSYGNQLKPLVDPAVAAPTADGADAIRSLFAKLEARIEIMQEAYVHLLGETDDDVKTALYNARLKGLLDEIADARRATLDTLARRPAASALITAPAAADGSVAGKRINESLRPERLTQGTSPEELRAWIKTFKSFYNTNSLQDWKVEDQQQWLLRCLNKFLAGRVAAQAEDDTPIFADVADPSKPSCLGFIEDEFRRRYPIAARRHLFYTMRFNKGTPMAQVCDTLDKMGVEADITNMSYDEHLALRCVTACPDDALKKEFLKLPVMSLANVKSTFQAWEQQQVSFAQMAKTGLSLAAPPLSSDTVFVQASQGGPRTSSNRGNRQKRGARKQNSAQAARRKELAGLCLHCGKKGHDSSACPDRERIQCSICGKPGHVAAVCFAAARAADHAASARSVNVLPQQDELGQMHAMQAHRAAPVEQQQQQPQLQQQQFPQLPLPQQPQLALEFAGQANAVRALGEGANLPTPFLPL